MKFGEFLVEKGFVDKDQLNEALNIQTVQKDKVGRILVQLDYLPKKELNKALVSFFYPYLKLEAKQISTAIANIVGQKVIQDTLKEFKAILYKETESTIELLVRNYDDFLIEKIELLTQKEVMLWILSEETYSFLASANEDIEEDKKIVVSRALSDDEKLNENTPYAKLIKEAVVEASNKGASDIHIVPIFQGISIAFRLHGYIRVWKKLDNDHKESLTNKLKYIVNMDLGIVGKPQDSRASFKALKLNLRANSLPVLYGEKIVLRLLDQSKEFKLSESGLPVDALREIRKNLKLREGLIVMSGPTGSGKTSTLYRMLCELDRSRLNISTLEQPVEYELEGISQVNISDENKSLTFSSALRALLRQDIDKVLLGEIRDVETAEMAIKAGSTGHMVLSTVHANSALEVIERFLTFGIDEFTLKSILKFSAAQRLVPKICSECSLDAPDELYQELGMDSNIENLKIKSQEGCNHCDEGTVGLMPVIEFLTSEQIEKYFASGKQDKSFLNSGLKEECLKLAQKGLVDASLILEIA